MLVMAKYSAFIAMVRIIQLQVWVERASRTFVEIRSLL